MSKLMQATDVFTSAAVLTTSAAALREKAQLLDEAASLLVGSLKKKVADKPAPVQKDQPKKTQPRDWVPVNQRSAKGAYVLLNAAALTVFNKYMAEGVREFDSRSLWADMKRVNPRIPAAYRKSLSGFLLTYSHPSFEIYKIEMGHRAKAATYGIGAVPKVVSA